MNKEKTKYVKLKTWEELHGEEEKDNKQSLKDINDLMREVLENE